MSGEYIRKNASMTMPAMPMVVFSFVMPIVVIVVVMVIPVAVPIGIAMVMGMRHTASECHQQCEQR